MIKVFNLDLNFLVMNDDTFISLRYDMCNFGATFS